ncbi:hypothetical protein ACTD5D_40795 [Nocardia takedensis]|uniref:hypothetical protein n=1 Tax=Nocardia takedensis TaxID=259390 RepID=UPI003F77326E
MTSSIPPVPVGAKDLRRRAACPACGADALHIESRLTALPIGTYSLAGVFPKVAAQESFWLVCRGCGAQARGRPDDRGSADFDPEDMTSSRSTT